MDAVGSTSSMFRNNSGAMYPYTVGSGSISIKSTNNDLADFYYFFYDWLVTTVACPGPRTMGCVESLVTSTCTIGDLAVGESRSVTVSATIDADATDVLNLAATVRSTEVDANTANDSASATVTVIVDSEDDGCSCSASDTPRPSSSWMRSLLGLATLLVLRRTRPRVVAR